jgi:hypothetical protein
MISLPFFSILLREDRGSEQRDSIQKKTETGKDNPFFLLFRCRESLYLLHEDVEKSRNEIATLTEW